MSDALDEAVEVAHSEFGDNLDGEPWFKAKAELAALRSKLTDTERERDRLREALEILIGDCTNPVEAGMSGITDHEFDFARRALTASPTMTVDPEEPSE